ncbi:MAG: hypothetical protein LQ338_001467 [Usnochroma carphineum]|nr:MAG: hypothetical protein LQ338_001467 [Usnochroma carphineum]
MTEVPDHAYNFDPQLAPSSAVRRIFPPRRPHHPYSPPQTQKYCSDRCRRSKPSALESRIENTFVRLLKGKSVVGCEEVEREIFFSGDGGGGGDEGRNENGSGSSRRRDEIGVDPEEEDGYSSANDDGEADGGVPLLLNDNAIPAPQEKRSRTNCDVTDAGRCGMQRARHRELVRQAGRRGVAFGFFVGGEREGNGGNAGEGKEKWRRVEAVQGGRVVESSFAKGEWGVRWRDGGG